MQEMYELTDPQKNIYLREKYYDGTPINNISFTYYIHKELNIEICKKTINKIIEYNDGLRIRISLKNDKPVQYIKNFKEEDIKVVDFSNRTLDFIKEEMSEDAKIPFKFYNSKLYKFKIYKMPSNKTGIYIKLHHIIADAWVCKILLKQFNEIYNSFFYNKEYKIEATSYIDFVKSNEQYVLNDVYYKDKKYWEEYLKDLPEAIQFKDVSQKKSSSAVRYTKYISRNLSSDIIQFCKDNGITEYAFFVAVYSIYLNKTLGKTSFTIGTPLLNRKNYKEKQTVGMYISTIPLKIEIFNEDTTETLIKRIINNIRNALKHQRYPYEKMLEYVRKENDFTNNLFDTILSYQNMKPDEECIDYKYNHFWNFSGNQQSSFEIHISDYNNKGQYLLNFDYKDSIVEEKEMPLIYERIVYIAQNIINNYNEKIYNLEYIPLVEKLEIKFKYNKKNTKSVHGTLSSLLQQQIIKNPNKLALKFNNSTLTYEELGKRIDILSNKLLENGIKENTPVTLLLDRSLEMIVSMFAVLKIGAYYVPVDPEWPFERLKYIIGDINSQYIITQKKNIKENLDVKWIDVDNINYDDNYKVVEDKSNVDKLAYVIYTSGTTGKPKGTLVTNRNVVGLLNSTYKLFRQSKEDIWSLFHTYTFDFSTWEIYGCLSYGGTLIIVPKEITTNPKDFLNLLIEEKVTILNQTPAYFYKVIEQEKIRDIDIENIKIRLIILGGEAVHAEPLKYWKNKYNNIVIYNGYGPTETTIFAIMGEIKQEDLNNDNIYIGYPLENYKIQILDENLKMLPIGYKGEICISGTGVCNGYLNNNELTKKKFVKDVENENIIYRSGDIGYFDTNGRVKYLGRNDNQVKIRGFRIELEEIEKELLKCNFVSKAIVFPIEDQNYTKKLVGFIETQKDNCIDEVITEIRKNLTYYMMPKLYQVKEFPLNTNGKIDRKKLLDNMKDTQKRVIKPSNELEENILRIVTKISNSDDEISIEDDFFMDLNFDSLDTMQMATMLNQYNISVQDINDYSNVKELSNKIQDNGDSNFNNKYQDVNILNKDIEFDLSNILLTGATGFLGIHILRELIKEKNTKKVYCLIREKNNINPLERLKKRIDYYFTEADKKYLEKVKVVSGNFETNGLGLNSEDYIELTENVKTIIHCGANVSHYGKYERFYKANVHGTKNIINFTSECNAKLAHISTLSVGGFSSINDDKVLNENIININQDFKKHVYMITKYEAECEILKAIEKGRIDAKIFRLGNIMPRLSDGKFQINKMDNGFICRIKTILDTNCITSEYKKIKTDISPVDLCAIAIVNLLKDNNAQTIYHINNNKLISAEEIIKGFDIKEVTEEELISKIRKLNDPYSAHLLNDMLNRGFVETNSDNSLTINILDKLGFKWNNIDEKYLKQLILLIKGEKNEKS